jgi:hypothetical protein
MKQIALYYPSIEIPDGKWLRNAILYSDKVSTIMPYEDLNRNDVTEETKILIGEELFEPKYVFHELDGDDQEVRNFTSQIKEIINSEEYKKINPLFEEASDKNRWWLEEYRLYTVKLSFGLESFLQEKGLLKYSPMEEVASLEKNTAIFYMTQLANFLASKDNNLVIPSTDRKEYEKRSFQMKLKEEKTLKINLHDCLPVPNIDVPLKKVISFKKKREKELLNFKNIILELEKKLIKAESDEERKMEMLQFSNNLKIGVNDVKKLLADSKIDFLLNSFSSLLDIKQPEIIGTITSAGIGGASIIANCPLVGLGAAAALLIGTTVSSVFKIKKQVSSSACSYVYYGQKEGIMNFGN